MGEKRASRSVEPIALSDGVVHIRPYRAEDVDRLYEAVRESIEEMAPWLPWCHEDYARAESVEWIAARPEAWKNEEAFSFAVVDANDDTFLGGCGLNQLNRQHQFANLGYWVRSRRTGAGVATRAARLTARFGFETLGLHRIEIVVRPENRASRRVAEKVGAVREGRCRNRLRMHGEPHDAELYSLIPADIGIRGAAP